MSYPIPDDGPAGQLLEAMERHNMRPGHIHVIVSAEGFKTVISDIFMAGDEYLDSDAVFGVKPSLVAEFERVDDPDIPAAAGVDNPSVPVLPPSRTPARTSWPCAWPGRRSPTWTPRPGRCPAPADPHGWRPAGRGTVRAMTPATRRRIARLLVIGLGAARLGEGVVEVAAPQWFLARLGAKTPAQVHLGFRMKGGRDAAMGPLTVFAQGDDDRLADLAVAAVVVDGADGLAVALDRGRTLGAPSTPPARCWGSPSRPPPGGLPVSCAERRSRPTSFVSTAPRSSTPA